jgi:hypothetical protein
VKDCDYCGAPIASEEQVCGEQGGDPPGTWMCSAHEHPFVPSKCRELHETARDVEDCDTPLQCATCGEHRDAHMHGMFFEEPTLGLGLADAKG